MTPIAHNDTLEEISSHLKKPTHAYILVGEVGTNKKNLALFMAEKLAPKSRIEVIDKSDSGSIGIDTVRQLYRSTQTKQDQNKVAIISEVETMSLDAQNAFLKLLEEPRPHVSFILTCCSPDQVLSTVKSRSQLIRVRRLGSDSVRSKIKELVPNIAPGLLEQIVFITNGRAEILSKLCSDEQYLQQQKHTMVEAKKILSSSKYERLVKAKDWAREEAISILSAMLFMAKTELKSSDQPTQLASICDQINDSLDRLSKNCNLKAELSKLFISY